MPKEYGPDPGGGQAYLEGNTMGRTRWSTAVAAVSLAIATVASQTGASAAGTNPGSVTTTQQLTATSTPVPIVGDFDGDGHDDVMWYVSGSGQDFLWSGKDRNDASQADRFDVSTLPISGDYTPFTGDFNGDGRDDIMWYAPGTNQDSVWYFTGRGTFDSVNVNINARYKALVADFDATDGIRADDIFFYNDSASYLWTANANETFSSSSMIADPPNGAQVFTGNFRQSALTAGSLEFLDVFFYVPGTGADAIWAGNGDGGFTKSAITVNGNYTPIVGNFDANSAGVDMTDVFWYGPGTIADSVWMNTGSSFVASSQTVNGRYDPMLVPSREATTQDDILWDSSAAGDFYWATNGNSGTFAYTSLAPSSWGGTDPGQRNGIPGDFNSVATANPVEGNLSNGYGTTCAITLGAAVKCSGLGASGQIGNGSYSNRTIATNVSGLGYNATAVAVGWRHACAVQGSSTKCWGLNSSGQLGNGNTNDQSTPVTVPGLSNTTSLALGNEHTCALSSAGTVSCWGNNASGQLGSNGTTNQSAPAAVPSLTNVTQISAAESASTTCARTSSGGVRCWGLNSTGQLGNGTTVSSTTPVTPTGLSSGITQVSSAPSHTCAVTTAGGVKCWGANASGQLGNGTTTSSLTPVDVSGLSGVASVQTAASTSCALLTTGAVKCWGSNATGQLGTGSAAAFSATPVDVAGLGSRVIELEVGQTTNCALTNLGRVQCWGANDFGAFGNGTSGTGSTTPLEALGGRQFSTGTGNVVLGNADVLWWLPGNATGQSEILWYDLDSLN